MKKIYLVITLLWFTIIIHSQAQQSNFCLNCTRDLSSEIPGLTIDSIDVPYCKKVSGSCVTINYFDVQYKENTCPQKPPNQWTNADNKCFDDLSALVMRVYYPSNHDYASCKLPAVIIFHAGSYAECSSYLNAGVKALSRKLCSRGFVVYDVNYRVGVIADQRLVNVATELNKKLKFVSAQQMLAIYRALQDARGAIRSIIQMQIDGVNSDKYQINTNRIFLAGISAGSLIAMSGEYLAYDNPNQTKIDALFPNVSTVLGSIDPTGVYYSDKPSSLNQDYFGKIKGILNAWGSLFVPTDYISQPYNFFSGQGYSLPPIISFHGINDTVFNYIQQGVYFSRSATDQYGIHDNYEDRCLPSRYTTPKQTVKPNPPTLFEFGIGSQTIYNMLHNPPFPNSPITTELYLDCEAYHGLDEDDNCGTCTIDPNPFFKPNLSDCIECLYKSNFGTSANSQEKTYDYIAGRAAIFFQTIIGLATSNINKSRFVDCENNRITCTGITTTSCSDTDECDEQ